ncbi:hypothetical protein J437_LFUL010161 [Ladona fulva]|uniref:Uncharacterized protein n=1 Tax=Ladona fulva TaxID=123851 RepID=A0A8K0K8X7_LADFU|nr:hypothetical protein J437_LFUL010161 [Ladona fulva]
MHPPVVIVHTGQRKSVAFNKGILPQSHMMLKSSAKYDQQATIIEGLHTDIEVRKSHSKECSVRTTVERAQALILEDPGQ